MLSEKRRRAFEQARCKKIQKYEPLRPYFCSLGYENVKIVPIVVESIRAWDPSNDSFLRMEDQKELPQNPEKALCLLLH
ncbi:hypothetical protein TNIN_230261 [Trichonephila inaurata madagascariensis]|uniref:Uncharacterized protein n=1 Tax=Trichonephila inaurata madagascariensis TaxID=2747483 RepID=A0A8X6XDQ6_9ARAC|nr:hypothetical protein TNIN_230261 [Trichonephila inaurata madagascariensis]